jgi:hypothetical protein
MSEDPPTKPPAPDLPTYLLEPLERQSPGKLETVAEYATALAAWKRAQRDRERAARREAEAVGPEERSALEDRGVSTDPKDYDEVPASGAYITVKETKPGYRYYYWQWREGDSWRNEYVAPVSPKED